MPSGDLPDMKTDRRDRLHEHPPGMLFGSRELSREIAEALQEMGRGQANAAVAPPANPAPPPNGLTRWLPTINVFLGVLLTASIALVGGVYKSSTDRLDVIESTANKASNGVERIDKERGIRISELDNWRARAEEEFRTWRIAYAEFQQMKGVVAQQGEKVSDGREERLRDRETDRKDNLTSRDAIMTAVSELKTEVALLRQSMEARRRDRDGPFGESQRWQDLPWSPPFPAFLRAIYSARESPEAILVAN